MTTTIHSLSYQVIMDNREFVKGAQLSRSELRKSKRMMEDSKTPAEKLQEEYKQLAKMSKAAAIDKRTYNAELAKANDRFEEAIAKTDKWRIGLGRLSSAAKVAAGVVAGVVGAGVGFAINVRKINEEIKDFERFGLDAAESLGTFRVIASDAGRDVEELVDATKNLSIRFGEAKKDGGGIAETFNLIGLSIDENFGNDPLSQLTTFAEAISQLEDETARLQIVDELLGDAGTNFMKFFNEGADAIELAAERANRLGLNISSIDIANAAELNKHMKEAEVAFGALTDNLTLAFVPALNKAFEELNDITSVDGQSNTSVGLARKISVLLESQIEAGANVIKGVKLDLTGTDRQRQEFRRNESFDLMKITMRNFMRVASDQARLQKEANHSLRKIANQKPRTIPENLSD